MKTIFYILNPDNVTLKTKVIIHFILITIILISIFFITFRSLEEELKKTYYNNLISIREIKKTQLEEFFNNIKFDMIKYSNLPFVIEASTELSKKSNINIYEKYDNLFKIHLLDKKFENLYLIDVKKDKIIYSLNNKQSENESITSDIFDSTNLQQLYYSMIIYPEYIKLVDFEFLKDRDKPSAYFATPIFDKKKNMLSILILELSIEKVEKIMTGNRNWEHEGLGKSGETYIVSEDCKMRNNSRFFLEDEKKFLKLLHNQKIPQNTIDMIKKHKTNVLIQEINTQYCKKIFSENKKGIDLVKDYRNIEVLSAYTPLDIDGVHWYLLAEIDKKEVFTLSSFLNRSIILVSFILFILLLASTYLFSHSITRPINKIKEAFEELGKGNFSKRIVVKRKNEFSSLAKSYNMALSKLEKLTQSVEYLSLISTTDFLTKLYNRRKFSEELFNNIHRTYRTKEDFCVAMLDIDFFKKVNDTYGHDVGDIVLKDFANVVKNSLRKTDILARWGGEEFIVLFIDTDIKNTKIVCEKIRKNIQNHKFHIVKNITCSIGVTQNQDIDDEKTIVERADKALYTAKRTGRNKVVSA